MPSVWAVAPGSRIRRRPGVPAVPSLPCSHPGAALRNMRNADCLRARGLHTLPGRWLLLFQPPVRLRLLGRSAGAHLVPEVRAQAPAGRLLCGPCGRPDRRRASGHSARPSPRPQASGCRGADREEAPRPIWDQSPEAPEEVRRTAAEIPQPSGAPGKPAGKGEPREPAGSCRGHPFRRHLHHGRHGGHLRPGASGGGLPESHGAEPRHGRIRIDTRSAAGARPGGRSA